MVTWDRSLGEWNDGYFSTTNKIHVAVATWEGGSSFDPKLKLEGIKLNISKWKRPAPDTIPWDTKASGLYMICTLSKHEAERDGYTRLSYVRPRG